MPATPLEDLLRLMIDEEASDLHISVGIRQWLDLPRGLILVTGPTGSGKSTTLASMLNTPAVAANIRKNKSYSLTTVVQASAEDGMISLEQSLANLHSQGIISSQEVMNKSQDRELAVRSHRGKLSEKSSI